MKKQTLLKGSVILLTSAVVAKVLGAFFKIPLTNQLGGVGMGYFSCAYGLFLPIYALSVTGLSAAVAGTVAHHSALEDWRTVRRIRRIARLLFAGLGLLLTMVMLAGAKPFAELLAGEPDAWVCMAFMAPSAFFGCVTAVERGYYEGLQNMYPTGISQAVEAAAKLVFGLLCSQFVLEHPDWAAVYFPDHYLCNNSSEDRYPIPYSHLSYTLRPVSHGRIPDGPSQKSYALPAPLQGTALLPLILQGS